MSNNINATVTKCFKKEGMIFKALVKSKLQKTEAARRSVFKKLIRSSLCCRTESSRRLSKRKRWWALLKSFSFSQLPVTEEEFMYALEAGIKQKVEQFRRIKHFKWPVICHRPSLRVIGWRRRRGRQAKLLEEGIGGMGNTNDAIEADKWCDSYKHRHRGFYKNTYDKRIRDGIDEMTNWNNKKVEPPPLQANW